MRILIVVETWGLIGGSERYAGLVADALVERGHTVVVLCAREVEPSWGGSLSWASVERRVVPSLASKHLDAAGRASLKSAIGGFGPDVIYALTARSPDAFELLLERGPVVRYVQDHTLFCPGLNKLHEDGNRCTTPMGAVCLERFFFTSGCSGYKPKAFNHSRTKPFGLLRDKLREIALHSRAAALLTSSRYMRAELLRVGLDQVEVLPYFAGPPERDVPEKAEEGLPLILAPARLVLPDKGIDFLLSALALVQHPFRALIAGDGPAAKWLARKALDEGLGERVRFAGWLTPEAMNELYAACRLVVCPSVWDEPFGMVGLEAMAHAKPVVAFDVGGIPEWLEDGENGLIAPCRDIARLAEAMDRLLQAKDLAHRMGAAGRERLDREFSREKHMQHLERCLTAASRRG